MPSPSHVVYIPMYADYSADQLSATPSASNSRSHADTKYEEPQWREQVQGAMGFQGSALCLATSTFKDIRKMCKSRTFSWRTCSSNLWYQVLKCIVWGPQCVSCNNVQNITLAVAAPVLGPNAATHLPVTSFCMEIIQNVQVINHPSISSISSIIHLPILPSINQPLTNH